MALSAVKQVIARAIASEEYRDLFFRDANQALAGFDLTASEQALLREFTPTKLYGVVGSLLAHQVVPIRASQHFMVIPHGMTAPDEPNVMPISLGPEIVFGNGVHATTQLCLAALEKVVRPGHAVLDLGTGTGILAMAAAKLGAASVLAVDILDESVQVARRNVEDNKVSHIVRVEGGSLEVALHPPDGASPQQADVVVANILAPVILKMIDQGLAQTLKPNGVLILSGLMEHQQQAVDRALWRAGMKRTERGQRGDWILLMAHKRKHRLVLLA